MYSVEVKNNKEIYDFCMINGITDINKFIQECFKQGFDIKRYGLLGETGGKEVIVEKMVEVPVEVNDEAPVDALPCGFEGFVTRTYTGGKSPFQVYKTKYDYPGEVIYNPPFGTTASGSNSVSSSGDNIRRTYLGISSAVAFSSDSPGYDPDFFQYKGMPNPTTATCTEPSHVYWPNVTRGNG